MSQSTIPTSVILASTLVLGAALASSPVLAKDAPDNLRGTISKVSNNGFTVQTRAGDSRTVDMDSKTMVAGVVESSLDEIDSDTFIGTANVKKNGKWQALEVVVFPASMKGTGLGDYPWDLSPSQVPNSTSSMAANEGSSMTNGTVESSGGKAAMSGDESSMTNGTVQSSESASPDSQSLDSGSAMTNGTVQSSESASSDSQSLDSGSAMTNGTVKQSEKGASQAMTVKVDYGKGDKGKTKTIHIPADVPVVALQKGSKSDIVEGAHVFVLSPKESKPAKLVLVGKNGTIPPM